MDRTTYCEASLRVSDAAAKAGATVSLSDAFVYTDYNQVTDEEYTSTPSIPTCEHNVTILDDTQTALPADPTVRNWGAWTDDMSDSSGDFSVSQVFDATLDAAYTTVGITMTFGGDAKPLQTVVTWYLSGSVVATQTDAVANFSHYVDHTETYDRVTIEFVGSSIPGRRIKVNEIDFGEIFVWRKDQVISGKYLEEVNLTSSKVTINTLDLSVHDDDQEFNMLNPLGVYACLQQKQELRVTEYINGVPSPMGVFYLDTWANKSSVVASFTAYDVIGLFDKITYMTSPMWVNEPASNVFAHIFAVAGWTKYAIDSAISAQTVSGCVGAVTVREALHQLCLAMRCSCVSDRNGIIQVRRLPSAAVANPIEKSQKFGTQKITQNVLINSVAVTGYAFTANSTASQLYSADLVAGTYTVKFSTPATGLMISGGTITASEINYATFTVSTPGTVTITGYQYAREETTYTYEAAGVTSGTRSQATLSGVYFIGAGNGADVAEFLYDDYQRRIVQSFSMALVDEVVGDNVDIDTMLGARKEGIITKLNIDLAGGFTAECEARG